MTDEISDDELERRMRRKLFSEPASKRTQVALRRKSDRETRKINPAALAAPNRNEVEETNSTDPSYFEYYEYSPEYGDPHWFIMKISGRKQERYRRCYTKAELETELDLLRKDGNEVRIAFADE